MTSAPLLAPVLAVSLAGLGAAPEPRLGPLFDRGGSLSAPLVEPGLPFEPIAVNGSRRSFSDARTLADSVERTRDARDGFVSNWKKAEASGRPVVDDPEAFFRSLYGLGQLLGSDTAIGPRISTDQVLRGSSRIVERRLSASPDVPAAFERFLARVLAVDSRSANRLRKRVVEALFEAALRPAGAVAAYFDGLLGLEEQREIEAFRKERQSELLGSFLTQTQKLLKAEEAAHPGPDDYNVAGVLVTGSLVYGTGLPGSDLDFFVLTKDGTSRHVPRLMRKLDGLRTVHGWPDWPDKRLHPHALPVDGGYAPRLASEFKSVVVSQDPSVAERYNAIPLSRPFYASTRLQRLKHLLLSPFYRVFLRVILR